MNDEKDVNREPVGPKNSSKKGFLFPIFSNEG